MLNSRPAHSFTAAFPLVDAKLSQPTRNPKTIARPRLTTRLMDNPTPSVVSIVGPPGYGKTVLLTEWAALEKRDIAWLTLDEFDNSPSVFLTYLAAALDRVNRIDPATRRALRAPGTRIMATAVPSLAAELHRWPRPGILVLDDAHRLVDHTCLDALGALVEHLPPSFAVVIASRSAPELPFGRLRAKQHLLEIGQEDLAFDWEETQAVVASVGQRISKEQAQLLADRTEGWPAAIYLAALGGADPKNPGTGQVRGRDGYIAEYLRSELRPVLDDHDVMVLTRTSILDVVQPKLAEHVSRVADATDRLRKLAHANLLISEIAGSDVAFRYHHLLRDHLAGELAEREPDSEQALHRRAATWYSGAGQTELAIEHALAGGDTDEAARMIEAATLPIYLTGHGDRLIEWLGAFDESGYMRRPTLAFGAALVYGLSGLAEAADHMADMVERSTFDGAPANGAASFESARAMLRAGMVRHGADDARANAATAAGMEGPGSSWRTLAHELLAQAHLMCGDSDAAEAVLDEAVASAPASGSYAFYGLALWASIKMAQGDWQTAEKYARESHLRLNRMEAAEAASAILVHAVAARVALHHGDVVRGREELVHAQLVRPLASYVFPSTAVLGLTELARAYLAAADPAGAGSAVAQAEAVLRRRPDLGALSRQLADVRRRVRESSGTLVGPSTLTPAELRLLPLLSTHLMFHEIADRLHVSKHTVKAQVVSIYGKLEASSRGEAVDRAIAVGLLEPFPGLALTASDAPRT